MSAIDVEELVQAATAADRREIQGHPSPEDLLAYQADEFPPEEDQRIREHLSLCSECTRIVLDLAAFPDLEVREPGLRRTPEDEAEDWQAIRQRLAATAPSGHGAEVIPLPAPQPPAPAPARSLPALYALAAALAAAALGLTFWVYTLRQQVQDLSSPRANVYSADLNPVATAVRRDDSQAGIVRVPEDMDHLLLFLNGADPRRFADYRVDLADARGAVIWSRSGLRRAPEGNFSLELPRASVPPGRYEILLFGLDGADAVPLATYRLTIEYASPAR